MADKTSISWTDATWNPVRGCSRVSEGCRNCYAERVAARFSDEGQAYHGLADRERKGSKWTGIVRLIPEHLADPLRWKKPRRIFVNSMSDMFHESLTNEQIAAVVGVMAAAPRHTFQVLTKRAKRMREWFAWVTADHFPTPGKGPPGLHVRTMIEQHALGAINGTRCDGLPVNHAWAWPLPNVWLGVSVENQAAADERIPELLATPAAVRFLSCEPLIGAVGLLHMPRAGTYHDWLTGEMLTAFEKTTTPSIDWVIAGCESGPGARHCDVAWLRLLRDQCATAGVPFFLKQAAETDPGRCGDENNPNGDTPCDERIRVFVNGPGDGSWSCGCTVESPEFGSHIDVGAGDGSKRKSGGVIELPYLDGVQHAEFPAKERG